MEYREVTLEERRAMMQDGTFDINGNISAHPGYTGIHKLADGSYVDRINNVAITDPELIGRIEGRNTKKEGQDIVSTYKPKKRWYWPFGS